MRQNKTYSQYWIYILIVLIFLFAILLPTSNAFFAGSKQDNYYGKIGYMNIDINPTTHITDYYQPTPKRYSYTLINNNNIDSLIRISAVPIWEDNSFNILKLSLGEDFYQLNDGYYYYKKILNHHTNLDILIEATSTPNNEYINKKYIIPIYIESIQSNVTYDNL